VISDVVRSVKSKRQSVGNSHPELAPAMERLVVQEPKPAGEVSEVPGPSETASG